MGGRRVARRNAAVVTVGSELTTGARLDTNTAEIARELRTRGLQVREAVSVGDDVVDLSDTLERLLALYDVVVVTGGLGPTHDDVTRVAAASALGAELERDSRLETLLEPVSHRHSTPDAARRVFLQADVIPGARIIDPTTGTAPGQVILAGDATLILLPGPPAEMRPMLNSALAGYPPLALATAELGVVGLTESDAQVRVSRELAAYDLDVEFTVLARPGDVRILLSAPGAVGSELDGTVERIARALGRHCYSTTGETLPQAVVRAAKTSGVTLAAAESCTGGLVAAALSGIPGASAVFVGGVVTYSNASKVEFIGVSSDTLSKYGAVSQQTATEMVLGVRARTQADIAVAVTGIAGPEGGTPDKPVGTVCFAVMGPEGLHTETQLFSLGSRDAVRERATAFALDMLRRSALAR